MFSVQLLKKHLHSGLLNKYLKDISPVPTDLVSDLEDAHEVDSIENDEEYWKTS